MRVEAAPLCRTLMGKDSSRNGFTEMNWNRPDSYVSAKEDKGLIGRRAVVRHLRDVFS
jgi:hypothetical protein